MELPTHYLIPPASGDESEFLVALERTLQAGSRLMQLKGKGIEREAYKRLATKVLDRAHRYGCRVLLTNPILVEALGADGLHMDSKALTSATCRPIPDRYLLAVSGHTLDTLEKGKAIGADLGVLSPIKHTKAHPDIEPLGWDGLRAIVAQIRLPVYALGGTGADDEHQALNAGAQGIAGHRGYWKG